MNVPRDYLLANQCEKGLRVLIHTPLVKSFYSRVSDEPDTKRRKWTLLYYKELIAVACSKPGDLIRQYDFAIRREKDVTSESDSFSEDTSRLRSSLLFNQQTLKYKLQALKSPTHIAT
jgi:hypothetical protein